jgi:excisionase family DNA binding protein
MMPIIIKIIEVRKMSSVTRRIKSIKQPYGGYISPKKLECIQVKDNLTLADEENIHSSLMGITVDYMTRFMMNNNAKESFQISLKGAKLIHKEAIANLLVQGIEGLDNKSIINACKLSGFDVCYRSSISGYKPVEDINPNSKTIENIRTMVNRCLSFVRSYGPVIKDNFTFEGGYTEYIDSGDGDYLTKDTLWDFKVSKNEPTNKHTLQLLVYYLMGINSIHHEFDSINNIGIFNPRLNKLYLLTINNISKDIIDDVSRDVIGYGICKTLFDSKENAFHKLLLKENQYITNTNSEHEGELAVEDITKFINVSKYTIYKWIRSGALRAKKQKNKYYINKCDLESFMKKRKQVLYIRVFALLLIFAIYVWAYLNVF